MVGTIQLTAKPPSNAIDIQRAHLEWFATQPSEINRWIVFLKKLSHWAGLFGFTNSQIGYYKHCLLQLSWLKNMLAVAVCRPQKLICRSIACRFAVFTVLRAWILSSFFFFFLLTPRKFQNISKQIRGGGMWGIRSAFAVMRREECGQKS